MNTSEACIETCNKLLRGELSAIQTYGQALEKFAESPESITLREILADHQDSAFALRDHVLELGGVPAADSGAWGSFAKAVEGTAKLLGDSAALQALREGEKHGINEYEDALESPDVMEEAKNTIRDTLLPRQIEHLSRLDTLQAR